MTNPDYKSIFSSTTFWGAVVTAVSAFFPQLLVILGVTPDAAGSTAVASHIATGFGFIMTVYGRFTAVQPVSFTGSNPVTPVV